MTTRIEYGDIPTSEFLSLVSTPAANEDYFRTFHKPLVKRAIARNGGRPIKLLDVACGYGYELDFLREDDNVILFGIDISEKVLEETRKRFPKATFNAHDVRKKDLPFEPESMDAAIAVNAMAYVPEHTLKVIYIALKQGSEAVVNFYDFTNPSNTPFFDYHLKRGARMEDIVKDIDGQQFAVKVLDLRQYDDERVRPLGRQMFFNGTADMEILIRTIGFEIVDRCLFRYESTANPHNVTDVFLLRK